MSRWEPDATGRLQDAALDLYSEQGFAETTVAEIAERAGLTERTFFRHFADKRDVLFRGSELLEQHLVAQIAQAAPDLSALDVVGLAVQSLTTIFTTDLHPFSARRRAVILSSPELLERELIKRASLVQASAAALRERGEGETTALLAAEAGIAVFHVAFERWATGSAAARYDEYARVTLAELRETCGVPAPAAAAG